MRRPGEQSIALAQCKPDRLTVIDGGRRYSDKCCNLVRWALRSGELHPLLDSRVELVSGHILRSNCPCFGPVAGEGMCKREVLANRRVGPRPPSRGLEHWNGLARTTGERKSEPVVRCIENLAARLKEGNCLVLLVECGLDEGELQDDLRLVGI